MKSFRNILLGVVVLTALLISVVFADYVTERHTDTTIHYWGTDNDFSYYCDTAGVFEFDPGTAGNEIRFGTAYNDAVDLTWYGDTDGDTVAFDEENCEVLFTDINLQLDDDADMYIGSAESTDGILSWDNTNAEVDLTTATGSIHFTCSAVPDGQYGLEVGSAIAGATKSEGAAAYFHTTLTGNIDAATYNFGSWLDITGGSPTASILAAGDFGIYESGATLAGMGMVVGLQVQTMLDNTSGPTSHYMMRFNTDITASDLPDGWFQAANPQAIAYTADTGTSATKKGAIKFVVAGSTGTLYLRCYDNYN